MYSLGSVPSFHYKGSLSSPQYKHRNNNALWMNKGEMFLQIISVESECLFKNFWNLLSCSWGEHTLMRARHLGDVSLACIFAVYRD